MTGKIKVTSADIKIALAEKKHSDDYFLTEVKSGPTHANMNLRILDALAIRKSWAHPCISGYEIKISRNDFLGDIKYHTYLPLVHELSIVCPVGLIEKSELPTEIGLIWYNPDKKSLTVKKKPLYRKIEIDADLLMYVIMNRLEKDRIPFYSSKAEHFQAWLDNKISNHALGIRVKTKIATRLIELEDELAEKSRFDHGTEKAVFDAIIEVMRNNGYWRSENPAEWLKEKFEEAYPPVLDDVIKRLQWEIENIERIKAKMKGAN